MRQKTKMSPEIHLFPGYRNLSFHGNYFFVVKIIYKICIRNHEEIMLNWTWHFITLWFCTAQHVILCGTVLDKTVKVKNKFILI